MKYWDLKQMTSRGRIAGKNVPSNELPIMLLGIHNRFFTGPAFVSFWGRDCRSLQKSSLKKQAAETSLP
jgi:hypothetical protein